MSQREHKSDGTVVFTMKYKCGMQPTSKEFCILRGKRWGLRRRNGKDGNNSLKSLMLAGERRKYMRNTVCLLWLLLEFMCPKNKNSEVVSMYVYNIDQAGRINPWFS